MHRTTTSDDNSTPPHRRGCLWALAATLVMLAVLTVVAVVAWRLLDDGRIRRWEELAALPEASLYYPGSTQLGAAGRDYEVSILARVDAFYRQTLGVDASSEEVRAFYARELPPRGWVATCEGGPCVGAMVPPGYLWRKGQLLAKIYPDPPVEGARFRTVYRIDIYANPPLPTPTAVR